MRTDGSKTLVILAAGIGSRFGGGVKQLEPVGPSGELIIDYSVHDAIEAGFGKIIFIIRHDIEQDFRERIGDRIERICKSINVQVEYAYQELDMYVDKVPDGRVKPWGTGHAVLCASYKINTPFAVINADDYYGKEGFLKAAGFLETDKYALVGYTLRNTLSDNGGVTRGICSVAEGKVVGIQETRNIIKTSNEAEADGTVIDPDSIVSMNFWCYPSSFIEYLRCGFDEFISNMSDPIKDEFLLPIIADKMIKEGTEYSVLRSEDHWFGVTYKADREPVVESFRNLYSQGVYRTDLYGDLG
ncbi:MobA-like NTP transferase domain-containing protein [Ruminococcaceae bacterium YRB3002]|nr:MobA-like NTP transferase domain-containing protein [Ruminococcaceae bacterium YRB3002]